MPLRMALVGLSIWLAAATAGAVSVVDPGFGPFPFSGGPRELSGLARVSGDEYLAVSDSGGQLVSLQIQVDTSTGAVTSVVPGSAVTLVGGIDLEGLVYDPSSGSVLVSDEVGPAIREHDPSDGSLLGGVAVPGIYGQARVNRSLESLALDPASGDLWTANEAALLPDGPIADFMAGSVVRLQRFDVGFRPDGQWAYVTDPIPGGPAGGSETSGVVDLLALPGGELLVLERSFSSEIFRSRLYLAERTGATDTTGLASLDTDPFVPVQKTLLWEAAILISNFEGIALGPQLDDGHWSLLLASDDAGLFGQAIYPLHISFVPEPGTGMLLATGLTALALRACRRTA